MCCTKFADKEYHHAMYEQYNAEYNIFGEEYEKYFNEQNKDRGITWDKVQEKINSAVKQIFKAY